MGDPGVPYAPGRQVAGEDTRLCTREGRRRRTKILVDSHGYGPARRFLTVPTATFRGVRPVAVEPSVPSRNKPPSGAQNQPQEKNKSTADHLANVAPRLGVVFCPSATGRPTPRTAPIGDPSVRASLGPDPPGSPPPAQGSIDGHTHRIPAVPARSSNAEGHGATAGWTLEDPMGMARMEGDITGQLAGTSGLDRVNRRGRGAPVLVADGKRGRGALRQLLIRWQDGPEQGRSPSGTRGTESLGWLLNSERSERDRPTKRLSFVLTECPQSARAVEDASPPMTRST